MSETATPPGALREIAAEHASDRVPIAAPSDSAAEVRGALVGQRFDCADDVAVLSGRKLVGLMPIERLLAAEAETAVREIMDANPPAMAPGTDREQVAMRMLDHGESSIAVVGDDGTFIGLVSPHSMLSVLLAEHEEDLARISGYVDGTMLAKGAAEEPVRQRLRHRLPWLLLGLAGAMLSAIVVGAFETALSEKVLVAFFVPAVVYMADAVGTQTETLLIRGMTAGIVLRRVVRRELATGAILGLIVGAAFVPFVLIGWGDAGVAAAVALALVASCGIATVVAMALPIAFQRFGRDPAFGAGPLATVIQDLLSIAAYLAIAVPLAT